MSLSITGLPLNTAEVKDLIDSDGFSADLLLDYAYSKKKGSFFFLYIKYDRRERVRQIYTQRNKPRTFKDIGKAIEWGNRMGFKSISFYIDYRLYE